MKDPFQEMMVALLPYLVINLLLALVPVVFIV